MPKRIIVPSLTRKKARCSSPDNRKFVKEGLLVSERHSLFSMENLLDEIFDDDFMAEFLLAKVEHFSLVHFIFCDISEYVFIKGNTDIGRAIQK